MSFAALCGFQGRNSLTSAFPADPSASVSTSALFGCALVSSGGGLRSTCESLLELSPSSSESAGTRSERGASRFGRRAGVESDREDGGKDGDEVEDDPESCFAGAEPEAGELCAHTTALPSRNTKSKEQRRIALFYLPPRVARYASRHRRAVSSSENRLPSCSIR